MPTQRNDQQQTVQTNGAPPDLREEEREEIEERRPPRAAVIYETIRREGEEELRRPSTALAWSGLAAGLSMGFSLVTQGMLRADLPDTSWASLISPFGYTIGFLLVILGRQQLFTENTLTPILTLLSQRTWPCLLQVLRLWSVVLVANLLGTLLFAWVVSATDVFAPDVKARFSEIGREFIEVPFWTTFVRAIFAAWLIAMMVWLLPAAETARVSVIIIVTYVVGVAHLAHSVAGSVETLYVVMTGEATWGAYLLFMGATLLGNILGGVTLVALLNYGQVFSGVSAEG